jgi:predicted DNA-binding transcriptional regulator AlpA
MKNLKTNDINRIVTPTEMAYRLGVSTTVLYVLEKNGKLPQRVRISMRRTGWRESDLKQFFQNLNTI